MNWDLRYAADKVDRLVTDPGPIHDPHHDGHLWVQLHKLAQPIKVLNGTSITHIMTGANRHGTLLTDLVDIGTPGRNLELPEHVWKGFKDYTHSGKYNDSPYLPRGFDPQDSAIHQTILDRAKDFLRNL